MTACAVIMSVYKNDKAEYLDQAVRSILDQDVFLKIHIYLAVDGQISAPVEKYIANNRKCFYRILRKHQNQGLARALNDLIDLLGDEEYIFRMDADDIVMPRRFSKQIAFMEDNPDIDVVGGGIIEFDGNGNAVTERHYPETNAEALQYVSKGNPLAHVTTCFRRRVFDQGVRYPTDDFPEDLALWFVLFLKGFRVASIPVPFVRVRVADGYYERRNFRWALSEMKTYLKGLYRLSGFSWQMLFPLCRFAMRCLPTFATRSIYQSRAKFMNPKPSENHHRKAA